MRKGLIIILFFAIKLNVSAQLSEIGVSVGGAVYNGTIDVTVKNFLPQTTLYAGVFAKYQLSDGIYLRAQVGHTELYADEKKYPSSDYRASRGLNFKTPLNELILTGEWYFFSFGEPMSNTSSIKQYSFYALGGAGIANYTPHPFADGNNVPDTQISSIEVQTNNKTALIIPVGIGARYMFSNNLALSAEFIGRRSFSCYVDGFRVSVSNRDDYYFSGGLSLAYVFSNNSKNHSHINGNKNFGSNCPRF